MKGAKDALSTQRGLKFEGLGWNLEAMGRTQLLLLPDPRPLVERLGAEFFRQAPQCPGVYLMRDAGEVVLYVGKAKNLRKRLASYRVANPERMPRRHLRLLRAVARIELQQCADESAALSREAELLLSLRPRFNRAGTWRGPARCLLWRVTGQHLEFAIRPEPEAGWRVYGPAGAGVNALRAALVRLLWCAVYPERGVAGIPAGWFGGRHSETVTLAHGESDAADRERLQGRLAALFAGQAEPFIEWVAARTAAQSHPFELAAREADLETLSRIYSVGPEI